MKPFESFMAEKLEAYIEYRLSLGFTDNDLRSRLLVVDRYARQAAFCWNDLRPSFFLDMQQSLPGAPRTVNGVLSVMRGFFQFLVRDGSLSENPLLSVPAKKENAYIPFLFSFEEIDLLLAAMAKNIRQTRQHFATDLAVYIAVMLLARCGMRISEPLRLLRSHYRRGEKTIYIEKTKFSKDRLIPLPDAAAREIENYLALRDGLCPADGNSHLLAGKKQGAFSKGPIYRRFHQAVQTIGLAHPRRTIANTTFASPTPHSLRHSFAVNTLARIKAQGKDPQSALPVLAAYMGHRKYRYTAVYLKVLDAQKRRQLVDFTLRI